MKNALPLLLALACSAALATGTPAPKEPPKAPPAPVPHYVSIDTTSQANAAAVAAANASLYANPVATAHGGTATTGASTSSATTGASTSNGGGAAITQGHSYALAAAPSAAPLPAGTCPQGDSLAWSIGWGFVTYSISSTRTEMQCLDKLLALAREASPKPAELKLDPTPQIHPPAALAAPTAAAAPVAATSLPPPAECTLQARKTPRKVAPKAAKTGTCAQT